MAKPLRLRGPGLPPGPFYFLMCEHPYIVEGNKMPSGFGSDEKGEVNYYVARVDLAGVSEETLKVWAEKKAIKFEGEEGKNDDEEFDGIEGPRKFKGHLDLFDDEGPFITDAFEYVVKDGVLKVRVPKLKKK